MLHFIWVKACKAAWDFYHKFTNNPKAVMGYKEAGNIVIPPGSYSSTTSRRAQRPRTSGRAPDWNRMTSRKGLVRPGQEGTRIEAGPRPEGKEYTCKNCAKAFTNRYAYGGHMKWCTPQPKAPSPPPKATPTNAESLSAYVAAKQAAIETIPKQFQKAERKQLLDVIIEFSEEHGIKNPMAASATHCTYYSVLNSRQLTAEQRQTIVSAGVPGFEYFEKLPKTMTPHHILLTTVPFTCDGSELFNWILDKDRSQGNGEIACNVISSTGGNGHCVLIDLNRRAVFDSASTHSYVLHRDVLRIALDIVDVKKAYFICNAWDGM